MMGPLATMAACIAACLIPSNLIANGDAAAVEQAVVDVYAAFSGFDKPKYRSLLTEDYLLLENGTLLDIDGDVAMMATPESGHKRTDAFDFRSVKVQGDIAYAVYFLKSEIKDKNGTSKREWLESAILRRSGAGWRMALLHSTKIMHPSAPGAGPAAPGPSSPRRPASPGA